MARGRGWEELRTGVQSRTGFYRRTYTFFNFTQCFSRSQDSEGCTWIPGKGTLSAVALKAQQVQWPRREVTEAADATSSRTIIWTQAHLRMEIWLSTETFSDPNTIQSPMMALAQLLPSKKQRVAYCQFCLVESNDGKPSWSYLSQPELEVRRQTGHREETKWTSEALASCQELWEVHEHWPAVMWSFQRDTPIVLAQPPISCLTFFPASLQALLAAVPSRLTGPIKRVTWCFSA